MHGVDSVVTFRRKEAATKPAGTRISKRRDDKCYSFYESYIVDAGKGARRDSQDNEETKSSPSRKV
jgi:hypothetical protein